MYQIKEYYFGMEKKLFSPPNLQSITLLLVNKIVYLYYFFKKSYMIHYISHLTFLKKNKINHAMSKLINYLIVGCMNFSLNCFESKLIPLKKLNGTTKKKKKKLHFKL